MKKNFLYIIAFLSVLVACTEETIEVGTPLTGQEVKFSVSMGNDSRTLYGQEEADGKSIKVNWVNGDKITVYGTTCAVKQSDYSVVAANSGNQNYADNLVKTGAAGIQWGSEASKFYAIYPAVDEAVEVNNGIVTINTSIRQYQNNEFKLVGDTWVGTPYVEGIAGNTMPDALMYAVTEEVNSTDNGGIVDLNFKPFSTVLKFKLNGCDFQNGMTDEVVEQTEINVSKITVHAPCPVTGSCSFTFDGPAPSVTGGEFEDIVIYPKQLSFKEGQSIEFSAFSMPLPYTMDSTDNLWTVEIETTNFGTHTYAIKPTSSQVLKAGEIHKVNIPPFAIEEEEISLPASNWLRWIPRNVYLSELSLPGVWYATEANYQSTNNLSTQYDNGIRAFHIDCRLSPSSYDSGGLFGSATWGDLELVCSGTDGWEGTFNTNFRRGTSVLSALQQIAAKVTETEYVVVVLTIAEKPLTKSNNVSGGSTVDPSKVLPEIYKVLNENATALKLYTAAVTSNTLVKDVLNHMIVKINVNTTSTNFSTYGNGYALLSEGSMASDANYISGPIVKGSFAKMNSADMYWGSGKSDLTYYYHQAQLTTSSTNVTDGSGTPSIGDRKQAIKDIIDKSSSIYASNLHNGWFQIAIGGYYKNNNNNDHKTIATVLNPYLSELVEEKLLNDPSPIGIVLMNHCIDKTTGGPTLVNDILTMNTRFYLNRNKKQAEWPDGNPYNQNGQENPPT